MNIPLREYWRLLSRYLVAQRGAALSMAALLVFSTGVGLAAPQVVRAFIDAALAGAPSPLLIRAAIGFFLVSLAGKALYFFARYRVRQVGLTATNALRIDLTAHLVRLDLGFHKTHPPGELIERVDGDVDALAAFLSSFVVDLIGSHKSQFRPLYMDEKPLWEKVRTIARSIYGAEDILADKKVRRQFAEFEEAGYGHYPICMAKTQYSFSTDPLLLGAPTGHDVPIREIRLATGAEFLVVICGAIMTMPGLPRVPSAENIDVTPEGRITGLF